MKSDLINEFDMALRLWIGQNDISSAVLNGSKKRLFQLAETLALIARYHSKKTDPANENFSFTANSSLSGGKHPCSAQKCRAQKINNLSSFATLYADEVYIQNPFEDVVLKGWAVINEADRHEILNGILAYIQLRPLIERGIVKYAFNMTPFCEHHSEHIAKPLSDRIHKKQAELRTSIHKELIESCSVTFNFENEHSPFFEIAGPEDIIEHGCVYFHAYQPVPPIFKRFKKHGKIHKLSRSEIEDSGALYYIIDPIIQDLAMQEWHTVLSGTSYLCDNKAQIGLASKINKGTFAANSTSFEKGMQHYLPSIISNDINSLVKLREREEEAFSVYRDKLRKLLQQTNGWDEREVSRIFRDNVLPEINIINKKVNDWKGNVRQSIGEKIIFGTGALTLGLYAGILPANVGEIVATLGGGSALVGVLMDYNKSFKEKQEARASDFYFLWQASK